MKRQQIEYTVLLSICFAAVLFVCFVFLLKPQWGKFKKSGEQQSELAVKLQKAKGKVKRLPALKKNVKEIQLEI